MTSWKNIRLWKKIMLGVGVVIILMLVIAGWSWSGINGIVNDATELAAGNKLVGVLLQREVDHLNWAGEVNRLLTDKSLTSLNVETDPTKCGFGKWYYGDGRKEAEKTLPALRGKLEAIEAPHTHLHESAIKIGKLFNVADESLPAILANREADHLSWSEKVQSAILTRQQATGVELDHTKCAFGKMLYGEIGKGMADTDPTLASLLEDIKPPHEQLHLTGKKIETALQSGDFDQATAVYMNETRTALTTTREGLHKLQARASANLEGPKQARAVYASETQPNLQAVQVLLNEMSQITKDSVISEDQMLSRAIVTRLVVVTISLIALVLGILAAVFTSRAITGPIKKVMSLMMELKNGNFKERSGIHQQDEVGLMAQALDECGGELQNAIDDIGVVMTGVKNGDLSRRVTAACRGELAVLKSSINESIDLLGQTIDHAKSGSQQVNTSAEELSESAQMLASGASEQAASLEQISSSMGEIEAQAKASDKNASQAQVISHQAIEKVRTGNVQMESMLQSMKEIDQNSSNVTKVIKVIEEIAFQTNLLALNAAVEAARAGKYGKGFAVVAEEVRSLAGRSAVAAKETNELIEKSVNEVSNGVKKADETAAVLESISESVSKVNDLVGKIAGASQQQSNNIEEINKGLSMMNNVVQQNSSISEETAAASEELSSQSTELQGLMSKFTTSDRDLPDRTDSGRPGKDKQRLRLIESESRARGIKKIPPKQVTL
ncbi:MAG: methyl-accepting chemotaxis protein [bacterium]